MGTALTAHRLRHVRGGREVLGVDELSVAAGERLAVLGPNGAGKTTLLRLLAGIERPTEGTVALGGRTVDRLGVRARRGIGYVTQQPGLLTTSVRRNVELPLSWRGVPRAEQGRRALAALDRLGIAHLVDRPAGRLSGGERQRVNLARSLATEPEVLLLDEPAAALDPAARAAFLDDLDAALDASATTVVHVSHRPEEAIRGADQVAVLDAGRVRQLAAPVEVFRAPADAAVARIVGFHNLLPAELDEQGVVRVGDVRVATSCDLLPGPVTVAVWAAGVAVARPGETGWTGTVRAVVPGPGRWEVRIATTPPLLAHLPPDVEAPRVGQSVDLRLLADYCAVLPRR